MSIAPIVQIVSVRLAPERAFALFATRMGDWWGKGKTIAPNPHARIVIEPAAGGRWYEEDASGVQCDWGRVLAWEPPYRLLLAWHLDASFTHDPGCETEVLVTFAAEEGGTRVTLEHRHLERFGASAARVVAQLAGGWPAVLGRFADFVAEGETR